MRAMMGTTALAGSISERAQKVKGSVTIWLLWLCEEESTESTESMVLVVMAYAGFIDGYVKEFLHSLHSLR